MAGFRSINALTSPAQRWRLVLTGMTDGRLVQAAAITLSHKTLLTQLLQSHLTNL
jgi:hypothetical protein